MQRWQRIWELGRLILTALLIFTFTLSITIAQETMPAAGGNASGSGGKVSYTVGQIFYSTYDDGNGSVAQGVQQPYEISVITAIPGLEGVDIIMAAYPNPTRGSLVLRVENYQGANLTYRIYDLGGKLIQSGKVVDNETGLHLGSLPPAIYLLRVLDNQKEIKSFKIIKN